MANIDKPHDGHRKRIRNRFLNDKDGNFEPHELLELLLFHTIPRANTNVTAHALIQKFGSLPEVFEKGNYRNFQNVPGIGEKSAFMLSIVGAVVRACQEPKRNFEHLKSVSQYRKFFLDQLKQETMQEVFMVACLSADGYIICFEKLEIGTPGKVKISLHRLTKFVMQANCTHIVLGHNHPNGTAKPSVQDIMETRKINEILKSLEIQLLDHIIVGNEETYSMTENQDF